MADEADELGWREETTARQQAETRGIPAHERVRRFARTEVRSVQAGGEETRPRVGTAEEQRALAALRQPGTGSGEVTFGGTKSFDI